jgi:integrase
MKEFLRLKRANIDLDKMRILIKIPTKNSTERYGYFTPEVRDILIEYFNLEPETHNAFNTTEHQLKYFVERMNQYLPPNKHISIHSLRHSYAIMLAERNVNVAIAQKLLGHRNITTTMVYYAPKDRVVERIYRDSVNFINPDEESYDIH